MILLTTYLADGTTLQETLTPSEVEQRWPGLLESPAPLVIPFPKLLGGGDTIILWRPA